MANVKWVDTEELRERVREHYGSAALRVTSGTQASCCGTGASATCCGGTADPITSNLYSLEEESELPIEAVLASLGCGNPTALARLNPGEVVLDLGSGGGIDVLLSAKRVGPTGFAYGLDMTDEMLELAEKNKREAGVENVKFLKGYIEEIPLPDNTVDVLISNCVINLSADKRRVLNEAFRVLKPGGRFAVSDVVLLGKAPDEILRSMEAWTGCIAGALEDGLYKQLLAEAGFTDIGIEVTRSYTANDVVGETGATAAGCCAPADMAQDDLKVVDDLFASAFIRATKPTV